MIAFLQTSAIASAGIEGLPLPYSLRMENWVTLVLLACFFFTAWILSHNRIYLYQQGRDFLLHRERSDLFGTSMEGDVRLLLLLVGQTCILAGIYLFDCFSSCQPALVSHSSSWLLAAIYMGFCLAYVLFKWLLYSLLGWIFLDKAKASFWLKSYSTLLYYQGFALFPLVLLVVYLNAGPEFLLAAGLVLLLFFKILAFYKCLRLFCNRLYGCFPLILYFCALEIIPCLILYRGLEHLNNYWIIKS